MNPQSNGQCEKLFPEFIDLFNLIYCEIEGISEETLDYTSIKWEWSMWSIRNQLSHMASLIPRWLITRWGKILFPNGDHGFLDLEGITNSPFDRRLDDSKYWELHQILEILYQSIELTRQVLRTVDMEFIQNHRIIRNATPQWRMMSEAHSSGITVKGEPASGSMTLEATFRHIYFEEITHLYNIQRLKKAQGLDIKVNIPKTGYWILPDWDRSQP
jgi:hypothetical protein